MPFLKEHIRAGANDVIVGWSSGAVAAMRYAENNQILGSILISPCYTDLNDEMEKLSGYYDTPWQWEKIIANQNKIALIWGDDDPFIPQAEFELIAKQLNPTRLIIRQGEHFIDRRKFPELLRYIKVNYL